MYLNCAFFIHCSSGVSLFVFSVTVSYLLPMYLYSTHYEVEQTSPQMLMKNLQGEIQVLYTTWLLMYMYTNPQSTHVPEGNWALLGLQRMEYWSHKRSYVDLYFYLY